MKKLSLIIIHTITSILILLSKYINGNFDLLTIQTILLIIGGYLLLSFMFKDDNNDNNNTIISISRSNNTIQSSNNVLINDNKNEKNIDFSIGVTNVKIENNIIKYKLMIIYKGNKFSNYKRFSEYFKFYNDTLKPRNTKLNKLKIPPKSSIYQYMSGEDTTLRFIENRKSLLDFYIKKSINDIKKFEQLTIVDEAKNFFKIPSNIKIENCFDEGKQKTKLLNLFLESVKIASQVSNDCTGEGKNGWFLYKTNSLGVKCYLKKDGNNTYAYGIGEVEATQKEILSLLGDSVRRKIWDDMFNNDKILADLIPFKGIDQPYPKSEYDTNDDDLEFLGCSFRHTTFKSPAPLIVANRDNCAVSGSVLQKSTNKVIVALISPEDDDDPRIPIATNGYVRAKIISAGFILEPINNGNKKCRISTYGMVDPNGSIPTSIVNTIAPQRAFIVTDIAKVAQETSPF